MRALVLNCTLKPSPAESNTEALARVVMEALEQHGVDTEDGAHHVIAEMAGALIDIGFTVPGQAWTYWNQGPGPTEEYLKSDHRKEWSQSTGRAAAANLVAVARALAATPIPPPPAQD